MPPFDPWTTLWFWQARPEGDPTGVWFINCINGNNLYADMKIVPHGNLQAEKTGMTENANKVPGKYYFLNVSHWWL